MSNPFHSGSPVTGEAFGDRKTETDFLVSRMLRGQNVFLMSPRRYGKTSLLLRAVADARRRGARVGMANLFYASDRREVAEHLTRAVIDGALGWLVGTAEQIGERLRRIPWVTPILERDGWQVALALSGRDPSFLDAIRRPVELLADSARDGHPVCLVVDEFQQVAEIDPALPRGLEGNRGRPPPGQPRPMRVSPARDDPVVHGSRGPAAAHRRAALARGDPPGRNGRLRSGEIRNCRTRDGRRRRDPSSTTSCGASRISCSSSRRLRSTRARDRLTTTA